MKRSVNRSKRQRSPPSSLPRSVRPQLSSPESLQSIFSDLPPSLKTIKRQRRQEVAIPEALQESSDSESIGSTDSSQDEEDPWVAAPAPSSKRKRAGFNNKTQTIKSSRLEGIDTRSSESSSHDSSNKRTKRTKASKSTARPVQLLSIRRRNANGIPKQAPPANRSGSRKDGAGEKSASQSHSHSLKQQSTASTRSTSTQQRAPPLNNQPDRKLQVGHARSESSDSFSSGEKREHQETPEKLPEGQKNTVEGAAFQSADPLFIDDGSGRKTIDCFTLNFSVAVMKKEAARVARKQANALKNQGRTDESRRLLVAADRQSELIIQAVRGKLRNTNLPIAYATNEDSCKRGMDVVNEQREQDIEKSAQLLETMQQQAQRLEDQLNAEIEKQEALQLDKEQKQSDVRKDMHPALTRYLAVSDRPDSFNQGTTLFTPFRPAPKGTMDLLLKQMVDHI